ncbi:FAD-binding protein [Paenibacillus albiflavus]|uniref:FAD-binding protein n=2 Tax=Paenibacillus albiflavus TaxID=2545760 RepID=A0A4R4E339_9BACL|nr:FAD-binding protein [Paenibacillus albiflavus]
MRQSSGMRWSNWSGSAVSTPERIVYPSSIEEISRLVHESNDQGKKVRIVGSGHSFTAIVPTDSILISLDEMQGIKHMNHYHSIAHVWAGTKLKLLGESLHALGYAQENLGDVNFQSIAGAVSTGTHGTGVKFGSVATQVVGITAVTADGSIVECDANHNSELFKAMQVSLGSLGIIAEVKLRVVPAWKMDFESRKVNFHDCMQQLDSLCASNRHFEFYIFPYSDHVQIKLMNQTDAEPDKSSFWNNFNKIVVENGAFKVMSEVSRLLPKSSRSISRLSGKLAPVMKQVGHSHSMFATPRLVKFNEMEYNIPAQHMQAALEEVRACIDKKQYAVHFPLECRYVKADDIWLSPAYGRDSAYIAAHMYKGMPHEQYFADLEQIFLKYDGRPHWGKLHTLKQKQLAERYPQWEAFHTFRKELDPKGTLLNKYLEGLFIG